MRQMVVCAPAKINHSLTIDKIQPNALHAIFSIMQKVDLYDSLEIEAASATTGKIEIELTPDSSFSVPTDKSNLIYAAIRRFFESDVHPDIRVILNKQIPVGAGLGGGSADTAAALRALAKAFPDMPIDITPLAAELGSDVPFFLSDSFAAQITGTGEVIAPKKAESGFVVLVKPRNISIATAWAYQQFDAYAPVSAEQTNDFEPCIFAAYPELAQIKQTLLDLGARSANLSGSGSTVFGVFSDEALAQQARHYFSSERYWSWQGRLLD